jgi:hypothetical protein
VPSAPIEAGSADLHQHLAGAGHGSFDLAHTQDVGRAIPVLDDRSHISSDGFALCEIGYSMGMLTILLIVVVVLLLTGGGFGYSRRRR